METIHIIGNLTKDAEIKTTVKQGVKNEFMVFTVACNDKKSNSEKANFYEVVSSKTRLAEFLKKGRKVAVIGNFRPMLSSDNSGKTYLHLSIGEFALEIISSAPKKDNASENEIPSEESQEDIPEVPVNFPEL